MNTLKILNILLAIALLVAIVRLTGSPERDENADFLSLIHSRKSVRTYTSQKVTAEQAETLVRAAMAAPTARNAQPWIFIAVDNRALLDSMGNQLPYARMLHQATLAIVVCGDSLVSTEAQTFNYWQQDCAAATQNILLATEAIGLGAVWTGVYPRQDRVRSVQTILNLPKHWLPLAVIPIGYPGGNEQPRDKWKPEKLKWNRQPEVATP